MTSTTDTDLASAVAENVDRALAEDVGSGDLTAGLIDPATQAVATIICREAAVICGQPWVAEVLRRVAPSARAQWFVPEGGRCEPNQKIVQISGSARELLTAERTCLNFLQTLSAVATKTAQFVAQVQGTNAAIVVPYVKSFMPR